MGGLASKLVMKHSKEKLTVPAGQGFFDFKVHDIHGNPFDLTTLRNKNLIMVINVASQ